MSPGDLVTCSRMGAVGVWSRRDNPAKLLRIFNVVEVGLLIACQHPPANVGMNHVLVLFNDGILGWCELACLRHA